MQSNKNMQYNIPYYRRLIRKVVYVFAPFLDDISFLKLYYWCTTGEILHLKNPKTFCEKINWLKINWKRSEFSELVDKVTVKEYVGKTIGEEFIIPTIQVVNDINMVDFKTLPKQFVIKCTHDSGGVFICKDKENFDIDFIKEKLRQNLERNFFNITREYPYKNVTPRILIESFLEDTLNTDLNDYKFYCFNGKAEYCQLITNRSTNETIDFYDRNWIHQEFVGLTLSNVHPSNSVHIRPMNYDKMLEISDKLAKSIYSPFVRIDLYNIKGRIYFGEITFYPASGMGKFLPNKWNYILGDMINI